MLLKFFGALFNLSNTDFKHPGGQAQSNDHDTNGNEIYNISVEKA